MDVEGARPGVVLDELCLDLADAEHGGLEDLFYVVALLGVDHLVVAVL